MSEVNWSCLHKILSDTTRQSILELLAEKEALSYTEIITVLGVTDTGRLNYHLKVLGNLGIRGRRGKVSPHREGRARGKSAQDFPERVPTESRWPSTLKIAVCVLMIVIGITLLINPVLYDNLGQHVLSTSSSGTGIPDPSRYLQTRPYRSLIGLSQTPNAEHHMGCHQPRPYLRPEHDTVLGIWCSRTAC